jgi:hypothetical protein
LQADIVPDRTDIRQLIDPISILRSEPDRRWITEVERNISPR